MEKHHPTHPRQNALVFLPLKNSKILIVTPTSLPVFSMAVDWLGFGYAALVASGGLIGYVKAGTVRESACISLRLPPPLKNFV